MTDTFDKFDKAQEKLGAHEIAAWLRRHPNFLQQFPDLALTLVVPREQGSAASLAGAGARVKVTETRTASCRAGCRNCSPMRRKTSVWPCARIS